jgi:hypothetical protein
MKTASSADARLRETLDRLLASPSLSAGDRVLVEEAMAIVDRPAALTITIRHDVRTTPEPTITSLRVGGER